MLLDNYGKKNIDDVPVFAKLFNDFKNRGYDTYKIINECITALSLRDEVIVKHANVNNLQI
jgi:hypothetical protein